MSDNKQELLEKLSPEMLEKVSGGDNFKQTSKTCPICGAALVSWYHSLEKYTDYLCSKCCHVFDESMNEVYYK